MSARIAANARYIGIAWGEIRQVGFVKLLRAWIVYQTARVRKQLHFKWTGVVETTSLPANLLSACLANDSINLAYDLKQLPNWCPFLSTE